MKVYLAGPMRGIPDNNGPAFTEAAAALRALGHEVWSPLEADAQATDLGILACMVRDLPALLAQEAVVLLDGWARSHGACLERHVADVVEIPVFLWDARIGLVPVSRNDWRCRAG